MQQSTVLVGLPLDKKTSLNVRSTEEYWKWPRFEAQPSAAMCTRQGRGGIVHDFEDGEGARGGREGADTFS